MRFARAAAWMIGLLCFALGCSRTSVKADLARNSRSDDDLVALLPRGLDAVLDVDIGELRRLPSTADLLALLPEAATKRLSEFDENPLQNLDALAIGLLGMGTGEVEVVAILRAKKTEGPTPNGPGQGMERIFASLRRQSTASEMEYHGLPLIEVRSQATALLSERTAVYGNRQTVRQVIDIFRNDAEGARRQSDLMQALEMAPRAAQGRPAIMLALLLTSPLRQRLFQIGLGELGTDATMLAVSLAVGDGIDIGVVGAYRELSAAKESARQLLAQAQSLRQRPVLRFLGMDRFVQPLVAVPVPAGKTRPSPELHLAYRLPGSELIELLSRLTKLQRLREGTKP